VRNIEKKLNRNDQKESKSSEAHGFECNICLTAAQKPVVTLCGHLYCWPCLYKWLNHSKKGECPVCKGGVTTNNVIPIYGRGRHSDPRWYFSFLDKKFLQISSENRRSAFQRDLERRDQHPPRLLRRGGASCVRYTCQSDPMRGGCLPDSDYFHLYLGLTR